MRMLSRGAQVMFVSGLLLLAGLTFGTSKANAVTPDTSTIQNQVKHNLSTLPWYGMFDYLQYQVNGNEVILSGEVTAVHEQTKYDAQKAVQGIPGVTKVVNNIEVLPLSTMDNQIRRAEYRAIFSKSDLGRYTMGAIPPVHIIVKNGHVTLLGVVINQMDKSVAGIAANQVPGVFSVTNDLQVG